MAFAGITIDSIVGTATTGVQSRFPRFTFDATSLPSLDQVKKYAQGALTIVSRMVRFKGYDTSDVSDPVINKNSAEDMQFITDWIELEVCAEIMTTMDEFKDTKVADIRLDQVKTIRSEFQANDTPFPGVVRGEQSEPTHTYPSHLERVTLSRLGN